MPVQRPTRPSTLALRAKLFRGLADHSRLSILDTLREGPLSVGEIAEATGLSQPNVSNHLRCLGECGLVVGEKDGRFVYYRLGDRRLDRLLALADELLAGTARGVGGCANYDAAPMGKGRRLGRAWRPGVRALQGRP